MDLGYRGLGELLPAMFCRGKVFLQRFFLSILLIFPMFLFEIVILDFRSEKIFPLDDEHLRLFSPRYLSVTDF